MAEPDLVVRSYRLCFDLERRIHSIDRWRIPVPYGVPLRGIAYGAVALIVVVTVTRLPLLGDVFRVMHPAVRLIIVPVAAAYWLTRVRVDGRPAHAAAFAWVNWRLGPRYRAGFRAAERPSTRLIEDVTITPDSRASAYRRAIVCGPAELTLRYPAFGRTRGRTMTLRAAAGGPLWRAKRVRLERGQRVRTS